MSNPNNHHVKAVDLLSRSVDHLAKIFEEGRDHPLLVTVDGLILRARGLGDSEYPADLVDDIVSHLESCSDYAVAFEETEEDTKLINEIDDVLSELEPVEASE